MKKRFDTVVSLACQAEGVRECAKLARDAFQQTREWDAGLLDVFHEFGIAYTKRFADLAWQFDLLRNDVRWIVGQKVTKNPEPVKLRAMYFSCWLEAAITFTDSTAISLMQLPDLSEETCPKIAAFAIATSLPLDSELSLMLSGLEIESGMFHSVEQQRITVAKQEAASKLRLLIGTGKNAMARAIAKRLFGLMNDPPGKKNATWVTLNKADWEKYAK